MNQSHLAVYLPEIVSHIFSFLLPAAGNNQDEINDKIKMYADLYPCLTVNRLWHDCSSRIIWRKAYFEDTKNDFDNFLKFASIITQQQQQQQLNSSCSVTTAALLAIGGVIPQPIKTTLLPPPSPPTPSSPTPKLFETTTARLTTYRNAQRYLSIRKIKEKSVNEPLSRIGQIVTNLKHLDIYICDHFSNEALYPFLIHQSLTYLSLAGCHHISDEAILNVAKYCKKLEHLDLRACGLVSDISLSVIAINCPLLRHLNVGRIRDREKVSIKSIALIAQYTKATVLGLAGCDIDDKCMQLLAKYRTTGLERVSVNSCFKISNQTIYAYIRYCPNLSVFEMKECHNVNDWEAVAELVNRKVLLTLCDQQNRACADWARVRGRTLDVKPPLK